MIVWSIDILEVLLRASASRYDHACEGLHSRKRSRARDLLANFYGHLQSVPSDAEDEPIDRFPTASYLFILISLWRPKQNVVGFFPEVGSQPRVGRPIFVHVLLCVRNLSDWASEEEKKRRRRTKKKKKTTTRESCCVFAGADFDADAHVRSMLKTKQLGELLATDDELCRDVKNLSGEMQMLVYTLPLARRVSSLCVEYFGVGGARARARKRAPSWSRSWSSSVGEGETCDAQVRELLQVHLGDRHDPGHEGERRRDGGRDDCAHHDHVRDRLHVQRCQLAKRTGARVDFSLSFENSRGDVGPSRFPPSCEVKKEKKSASPQGFKTPS